MGGTVEGSAEGTGLEAEGHFDMRPQLTRSAIFEER